MLTATRTLVDLRVPAEERPTFDASLRTGLQGALEDALRSVPGPLTVTKTKVNKVLQCEGRYQAYDPFAWTTAMAKGTIVHKAIELTIGGVTGDVVAVALQRVRAENHSLADLMDALDASEVDALDAEADEQLAAYRAAMGNLPPSWWPNVEATTAAWVGHRRVTFFGRIDLKIGAPDNGRSSTLLIDFKTGSPGPSDMDDLRLYALLETLRTGVPPFRWANVYLATGEIVHEDASEMLLWGAAERLATATLKISKVEVDNEVALTPGPHCRFCPVVETCEKGMEQ